MGIKKSYEEIKEYIEQQGYKLLSKEYINNSIKLKMECCKGHECEISWGNFQQGKRCKYCRAEEKKWSLDYISDYLNQYGYKLIKEVKQVSKGTRRFLIECPCGHQYEVNFIKFKNNNRRCPICQDQTFTYDYVKEYIESQGYELLEEEYINTGTEMKLKHKKCGSILYTTFHSFKNGKDGGKRCLRCKEKIYKGEEKVKQYLDNMNIDYIPQKRFNDCRDIQPLPFDIYIPSLNLAIEYDGEQHFDPKHSFNGEIGFGETVLHDAMKNAYCKDNNINLLRIPYWEFNNIENIICQEIEKLKTFND